MWGEGAQKNKTQIWPSVELSVWRGAGYFPFPAGFPTSKNEVTNLCLASPRGVSWGPTRTKRTMFFVNWRAMHACHTGFCLINLLLWSWKSCALLFSLTRLHSWAVRLISSHLELGSPPADPLLFPMHADDLSLRSKTICPDDFSPAPALVALACLPAVFFQQHTRRWNQMQTSPPINTSLHLLQETYPLLSSRTQTVWLPSLSFSKHYANTQLHDAETLNLGASCDSWNHGAFLN